VKINPFCLDGAVRDQAGRIVDTTRLIRVVA